MATEEILNTQAAAELLTESLPEKTADQWGLWLRNNRNQSRPAIYRVKAEQIGRVAFYTREELAAFVEFEQSRQLGTIKLSGRAVEALQAVGYGTAGGSMTGRKLKISGITPQVDQVTGQLFIQIIQSEPLMVYRLELEEAKAIAKDLNETIAYLERTQKDNT